MPNLLAKRQNKNKKTTQPKPSSMYSPFPLLNTELLATKKNTKTPSLKRLTTLYLVLSCLPLLEKQTKNYSLFPPVGVEKGVAFWA